jgi:Holliday junction resolvase RusA-like endonuclease
MIAFTVRGLPVPQGSTRAFVRGGRPIVTSDAKGLGAWRTAIASEARFAMGGLPMLRGPVRVQVEFELPRPASRPKRDRWPDRRPDLDKLVRASLDSMTGVVFGDDSQVVRLSASKIYGLDELGARIVVEPIEDAA